MVPPPASLTYDSIDLIASPAVAPVVVPKPTVELETAEKVVANHTASKLDGDLNRSYLFQSFRTGLPLALVDLTVTTIALLVVSHLVQISQGHSFNPGTFLQLPALLFLQFGLFSLHQLYPGAGLSPVYELRGIVRSTGMAILCLCAMNLIFGALPRIEFVTFVLTAVAISLTLPVARSFARERLGKTQWWGIRTLLLGSHNDCVRVIARQKQQRGSGFVFAGYVSPAEDIVEFDTGVITGKLGITDEAFDIAREQRAPVAAIVSAETQSLAHRLMFQFPSLVWIGNSNTEDSSSDLIDSYSKRLNTPLLRVIPRLCKRTLDLAICIPTLVVLAIPMAVIALAIKLRSPGPIFYASERVGQHGKRFKMWKFRSMVMNSEEVLQEKLASDPEARREFERDSKLKSDPRIIAGVGHLLRRWSLDELPQLWNVLIGEMSLVGPRPVLPSEIVRYQNNYYEYTKMWPGLTGLWQVSGRNETTFGTRVFLVHHYAANWSLWLDACILFKTPIVVLTRRGAY